MAETRKHREEVRDELDQALRAALKQPERPASVTDETGEAGTPATPFITPGSTIAGFTFGNPPTHPHR